MRRRSDGVVVPAVGRHVRGRSAYLCAARACFTRAVQRRALERSLGHRRAGGSVTVRIPAFDALWAAVHAALDQELQNMQRSGDIRRSPRQDALEQLRRGLLAPGRSA